jgi:hypothetical protein
LVSPLSRSIGFVLSSTASCPETENVAMHRDEIISFAPKLDRIRENLLCAGHGWSHALVSHRLEQGRCLVSLA